MDATAINRPILEYKVEPLQKNAGETDVEAVKRILSQQASDGWEIVDSCGDEVRRPVLIFEKTGQVSVYTVEEIPHAWRDEEVFAVSEKLWKMKEEGWVPECVLDSPISKPIGVFKKLDGDLSAVHLKAIPVPVGVFEKTSTVMVEELLDQQVRDNLSLQCIMHGGLEPVLILISKTTPEPYEYLVEYAKGGIFSNKSTKLTELILSRTGEGWQVCGAYEDSFLFPCLVFRRATADMPVAPREVAEAVENEALAEAAENQARAEAQADVVADEEGDIKPGS